MCSRARISVVLLLAVAFMAGCGGGGAGGGGGDGNGGTVAIARVEGTVVDASTNDGVQGVQVTIDGSTGITDADGSFLVEGVGLGSHDVQVEPPGSYVLVGPQMTVQVSEPGSTVSLSDDVLVYDTVVGGPPTPPFS